MKKEESSVAVPKHIAVIMDGNRRWAKDRGLPVLEGHRKVVDGVLEPLIEHAADRGVEYLTFWAWSTENWRRDEKEVGGIMKLFRWAIDEKFERLHKKGVRIRTIGDISRFEPGLKDSLKRIVERTKDNTRITVLFALNYGGRDELVRAINTLDKGDVTEASVSQALDTAGIPDPDIIIRTGGEQRLSGFLLWQCQYSELIFPQWRMPEFTPERFDEALLEYFRRNRRFGA